LLELDPGDTAQFSASAAMQEVDQGIAGLEVSAGSEHRVSLFAAHSCAAIPDYQGVCGHIQEQIASRLSGHAFVLPRMPIREPSDPEPTLWQVLALDGGFVSFAAAPGTVGLPPAPVYLEAGEVLSIEIGGPSELGDASLEATMRVLVAPKMAGRTFDFTMEATTC
jgi:hypothetical protein